MPLFTLLILSEPGPVPVLGRRTGRTALCTVAVAAGDLYSGQISGRPGQVSRSTARHRQAMGIQPIRKTVVPEIPDKLYFRIGDVARICEVPAYVLRFWETEFPQLKPNKGGTGQRLYRKRDVEMALRIKSLLYDQGYTIPGARSVFKTETKVREVSAEPVAKAATQAIAPVAMEAAPAEQSPASTVPVSNDYDAGAEVRRQVKLHALRAELQALLELLQDRVRPAAGPAKVQPMRPRLVLEPRQAAPRPEPARQEMLRLVASSPVASGSRDLLPGE